MTTKAEIRMKILFSLGCSFDGTSINHERGVQVAHWELDSLEEMAFLKVIHHLVRKEP